VVEEAASAVGSRARCPRVGYDSRETARSGAWFEQQAMKTQLMIRSPGAPVCTLISICSDPTGIGRIRTPP